MRHFGLLVIAFAFVGCASSSRIVPVGPDTYVIMKQAGSGFAGTENIKFDAIADANAFCAKEGKQFQISSSKETAGGTMGRYPTAEVSFMCLKAGDKDLARPVLAPAPNTVIEVR